MKVIICDIDGTVAKKGDRDIFDWSKVDCDLPIQPVIDIIKSLSEESIYESIKLPGCGCCYEDKYSPVYEIIFLSGREESCKEMTIEWLKKHGIWGLWENNDGYESKLLMRKTGDYRDDTIIKKEIYENEIKNKYDIIAAFDDKPKVIRMWRELGLFVFNCAQHDLEF